MAPSLSRSLLCLGVHISFVSCSLEASQAQELRERFVAPPPLGNDNNPGTLEAPFATITRGISSMRTGVGDTLTLRAGTYRETAAQMRSGNAENPTHLRAYKNGDVTEDVIISGLDVISPGQNTLGDWFHVGGNVYAIDMVPVTQVDRLRPVLVMKDGAAMGEARWPNAAPYDFDWRNMMTPETSSFDSTSAGTQPPYPGNSFYTAQYTAESFPDLADNAWLGGRIDMSPGSGNHHATGVVIASSSNSVTVRYPRNLSESVTDRPSPIFLWNSLVALDSPSEVFYDLEGVSGPANRLYVWMENGDVPQNHTFEIRTRVNGLSFQSRSHVTVEGISLLGCNLFSSANCSFLTYDGVSIAYGGSGIDMNASVAHCANLKGDNHVFKNGTIRNSFSGGIKTDGDSITITNNVIGNCMLFAVGTYSSSNIAVERNTMFGSRGTVVEMYSTASRYLYNHCYHGGMRTTDKAIMNSHFDGDALNTEVAWNWVHSNVARFRMGFGIRLDSGGSLGPNNGVSNYLIHHNIIWNTSGPVGLALWGLAPGQVNYGNTMIRAYHNTVKGDIAFNGQGRSVAGHDVRNNILADFRSSTNLGVNEIIRRNNILTEPANLSGWPGNFSARGFHVSASTGNFGVIPGSFPVDIGEPVAGVNDSFTGAGPDLGALEIPEDGSNPYHSVGAVIDKENMPQIIYEAETRPGNRRYITMTNFPLGRLPSDDFRLRLSDGTVLSDWYIDFVIEGHESTVRFPLPQTTQTLQLGIEYSLDAGLTYHSAGGTAQFSGSSGLRLDSIDQTTGIPETGQTVSLTGDGFGAPSWRLPIQLEHVEFRDLNELPVPVVVDTASHIDNGRMRLDCGDLRFRHPWFQEDLPYWLESGVNGATTLAWVKYPTDALENRFSHLGPEGLMATFGFPSLTSASERTVITDYFQALDNPTLLIWLSANDLEATHNDGDSISMVPDRSGLATHAVQALASAQPQLVLDAFNGFPALKFDGSDHFTFSNIGPVLSNEVSMLAVYKTEDPALPNSRLFSSGTSTGNETLVANAPATSGQWALKSTRRPDGPFDLERLTMAKRYLNPVNYFTGEIAEVFFFTSFLSDGSEGDWARTQEYVRRKYQFDEETRGRSNPLDAVPPMVLRVGSQVIDDYVVQDNTLTFTIGPASSSWTLPHALDVSVEWDGDSADISMPFAYYVPSYTQNFTDSSGQPYNPGGNEDFDDLINLEEYAFGGNPEEPDSSPQWFEPLFTPGEADLARLYFRRRDQATDALLTIERSLDLVVWEELSLESLGATPIETNPVSNGDTVTTWMIELPPSLVGNESFRIRTRLLAP